MNFEVGPLHDRRIFNLELPKIPIFPNPLFKKIWLRQNKLLDGNKIGCLISGGIDSAIMYFLLIEENINTGNKFEIIPYTILRIGAEKPAYDVINWIHNYYSIPNTELNVIGDPTLEEIKQVDSGIEEVLGKTVGFVYVGVIADRPEHYINWTRLILKQTLTLRYPLENLEKSHIIDLYVKKNVMELMTLTTSCNYGKFSCGICNGCEARRWGFEQLNLKPL